MRALLHGLFVKSHFVNDGIYDWDDEAPILKPLPGIYLTRAAAQLVRANERKVKVRKAKRPLPKPRNIFLYGWKK